MINNNSTLDAQQSAGSAQSARKPSPTANGRSGGGSPAPGPGEHSFHGRGTVARTGFAPPDPALRVELIVGAPITDTKVELDEAPTDEFVTEAEAVVPTVDENPTDDESHDDSPVGDDPAIDHSPADVTSLDEVSSAVGADDPAPQLGDDFWTGAASEGSVPTRKVVYGARSTNGGPTRRGWVKTVRRRRR